MARTVNLHDPETSRVWTIIPLTLTEIDHHLPGVCCDSVHHPGHDGMLPTACNTRSSPEGITHELVIDGRDGYFALVHYCQGTDNLTKGLKLKQGNANVKQLLDWVSANEIGGSYEELKSTATVSDFFRIQNNI